MYATITFHQVLQREAAVKQLVWMDGALYSGDDTGKICKVCIVISHIVNSVNQKQDGAQNVPDNAVVPDAGLVLAARHIL